MTGGAFASEEGSAPGLTVEANRDLTQTSIRVENRMRGVATATIVTGEVSLIHRTHVVTKCISKVVELIGKTVTSQRLAF